MKEIWKDVKGYEGIYKVSNYGNVKVLTRGVFNAKILCQRKGRLFNKNKNTRGYINISLTKDGIKKNKLVHRLVAETFIENEKKYIQVNHKDGNKTNNMVDNLEWCSPKQNISHAIKQGLIKTKTIYQYDKNMNLINIYVSSKEAFSKTNVDRASIIKCCNGLRKTAGGYIWKH